MKSTKRCAKMLERIRKRTKSRNVGLSIELAERIKKKCNNCISVSAYVRMAVIEKLERSYKRN